MNETNGRTVRSPSDLVARGLVDPEHLEDLTAVAARYAIAITPAMAELIDAEAGDGAIAKQFVPTSDELETTREERADPIGDKPHEVTKGLIHRYPDRVLLKLINVCAVYCRFCFRREMVGPHSPGLGHSDLDSALAYIADHSDIWEVVVSGGDPLVASPRRLGALVRSLAGIDHVKIVRFHTRVPVVSPETITDDLIKALRCAGITTWIAIHANHPDEFVPQTRAALVRMADAGLPLVSQTVLLKGVNDDAETLAKLMRTFVENRIKPYYLHHGDLAPGTSGFRTTLKAGQSLMRNLRRDASGLCQPTYVLDIPGGYGKVPVGPCYASADGGTVEDPRGEPHTYPPGTK